MSLSPHERDFVLDGIDQDLRVDGRGRLDHRSLTLELGTSPQASGSARLRLGSTDVMVAVRADIGTPPAGFPTHGRLSCAVELSASADPAYEGRGGEKAAAELSRGSGAACWALPRAARLRYPPPPPACAAVRRPRRRRRARDGSLGIQKGKSCWVLRCDCLVALRGLRVGRAFRRRQGGAGGLQDPQGDRGRGPEPRRPHRAGAGRRPGAVREAGRLARAPRRDGDARSNARTSSTRRATSALGDYALAVAVDKEGNVRGVSTMSTVTGKSVDVSSLRAMTKAARDVARRLHARRTPSSSPPSRGREARKTTKTTARSARRVGLRFSKSIF